MLLDPPLIFKSMSKKESWRVVFPITTLESAKCLMGETMAPLQEKILYHKV